MSKSSKQFRNKAKQQAAKDNYQDAQADWNKASRTRNSRGVKPNPKDGKFAITTGSKDNDPSWYTKNPTILRNVATIPFGYVLGDTIQLARRSVTAGMHIAQNASIPGIMRIRWIPFTGVDSQTGTAQLGSAPINVAGEQAYSELVKTKSVTKEFDPCDVTIYYLAMDSAISYYAWLIRIYGVIMHYSSTNRYVPRRLVQAMGVNFDDIIANMANFRLMINLYQDRLKTMYVPKTLTYITRHVFMSEGIYTDSQSNKPQLYLYNPCGFYVFDELATPARLQFRTPLGKKNGLIGDTVLQDQLLTYTQLATFANEILDPIIASQDLNIISSYVKNAYGEGGLFQTAPIAETFAVQPVYSPEVLSQFENAESAIPSSGGELGNFGYESTIMPTNQIGASVIQAYNALVSTAADKDKFVNLDLLETKKRLINFHKDAVTPEDIMVATRMKTPVINLQVNSTLKNFFTNPNNNCTFKFLSTDGGFVAPTCGGSEICYDFAIFSVDGSNMNAAFNLRSLSSNVVYDLKSGATQLTDFAHLIQELAAFDWHPFVNLAYRVPAVSNAIHCGMPTGDYDNFTYIDQESLDNMHYYALLSQVSSVN